MLNAVANIKEIVISDEHNCSLDDLAHGIHSSPGFGG